MEKSLTPKSSCDKTIDISKRQYQKKAKKTGSHIGFPMLPIIGMTPFHASYDITRFSDDGKKVHDKIYRLKLPIYLLTLLERAKELVEDTSKTLSNGWMTDIYSLTRQDIPVSYNPDLRRYVQPITDYITYAISMLYESDIEMADQHQPHILKYSLSDKHTGVRIHRDRCDITANLMMSKKDDYEGGGTHFPALGLTIKLAYGELLLHPGSALHSGESITNGSRYLFVMFANKKL